MLDFDETIGGIQQVISGEAVRPSFLTPCMACACAVLAATGRATNLEFRGGAETYAQTVGLTRLLRPDTALGSKTGGSTYSPLVELLRPETVDQCADSIRTLMLSWLPDQKRLVNAAAKILWEVMDNVPAHARGLGYAMAQTYPQAGVVEIAVADGGVGMLQNVRKSQTNGIDQALDAIQWCLGEGNSTVPMDDPWAQRTDWDNAGGSSLPAQSRSDGGAHAGLGLATLSRIVDQFRGEGLIWSGTGRVRLGASSSAKTLKTPWNGVVVAVRLPLPTH